MDTEEVLDATEILCLTIDGRERSVFLQTAIKEEEEEEEQVFKLPKIQQLAYRVPSFSQRRVCRFVY